MSQVGVLVLLALRHFAYYLAPSGEGRWYVWKVCSAVVVLILLWSPPARRCIGAWWFAAEEALVVGCNGLYLLEPWPGEGDVCSDLAGFELAIGSAAITLFAAAQAVRSYR